MVTASLFFFKIGLAILFDVLERKQGFLDNKNNFLRKLHIRSVKPIILVKKLKSLPSLFPL